MSSEALRVKICAFVSGADTVFLVGWGAKDFIESKHAKFFSAPTQIVTFHSYFLRIFDFKGTLNNGGALTIFR